MPLVSNRFVSALVLALVALVAVSAGAQNPGGSADGKKLKNPVASSPESIKAGATLYGKYCKFCHGADAKGNGPMAPKDTHPPNLIDAEWLYGGSDGEIFSVIRDGAGPPGPKQLMKPFKSKMTEQEIWQVVTYLRSLGP